MTHSAPPPEDRAESPQPTLADAVARGAALRAARERRGWNQVELGRRAGLSRERIGRLEHGYTRDVRPDSLHGLLRALEMPVCLAEVRR